MTTHLSLDTFLGNLMQLQTIVVSSFGSNGPLWSLANEWWYYVAFGLFMMAYGSGPVLVRFAMVGAIVAMMIVLPLNISLWLVIWGVGVGAAWTTIGPVGDLRSVAGSQSFASSPSDGSTLG